MGDNEQVGGSSECARWGRVQLYFQCLSPYRAYQAQWLSKFNWWHQRWVQRCCHQANVHWITVLLSQIFGSPTLWITFQFFQLRTKIPLVVRQLPDRVQTEKAPQGHEAARGSQEDCPEGDFQCERRGASLCSPLKKLNNSRMEAKLVRL